jgi:hypothetical protein
VAENAGFGRTSRQCRVNVMIEGRWQGIGSAEILFEGDKIVKVLSFTPDEFGAGPPPLCPLSEEGQKRSYNSQEEFMAIYNQGPPLVDDLGPGYYRPWVDGVDSRF